jgi:hypothetical protein
VITYHTTDKPDEILSEGWRVAEQQLLIGGLLLTGVRVADTPLDGNEGARGDQVFRVEFPDTVDLGEFELVEEEGGTGYREWYLPAGLIDSHATVTWMTDDAVDEVKARRWQFTDDEVDKQIGGEGDEP